MPIKVLLISPGKDDDRQEVLVATERLLSTKGCNRFVVERLAESQLATLPKSACLPCENLCVLANFENKTVLDQLVSKGYRIYGPRCIADHLNRRCCSPLPRRFQCTFARVLAGTTFCCSGISREPRERICRFVQWLGGNFRNDLTTEVTHLVANKVNTEKCIAFRRLGKPIFTPALVDELWKRISTDDRSTSDSQRSISYLNDCSFIKPFKLLPFSGLSLSAASSSDFCEQELGVLKQLTEKNGGVFSGEMKQSETTHLLVRKGGIAVLTRPDLETVRVVSLAWFTESVRACYCWPEEKDFPDANIDIVLISLA